MAITLDATVGGASANSYLDAASADVIMEQHGRASWAALTDEAKKAALILATRAIERLSFKGYATYPSQALRWPRQNMWTREGIALPIDAIPNEIKWACAEMAFLFTQENRFAEAGTEGFSQITLGSLSLTIDKHDRAKLIPDFVRGFISHFMLSASAFNVQIGRA